MKTNPIKFTLNIILLTILLFNLGNISYGTPKIKINVIGANDLTFFVQDALILAPSPASNVSMLADREKNKTVSWVALKQNEQNNEIETNQSSTISDQEYINITFLPNTVRETKRIDLSQSSRNSNQSFTIGEYTIQPKIRLTNGSDITYTIDLIAQKNPKL